MKIVEDTPDRLVIRHVPWLVIVVLVVLFALFLPAVVNGLLVGALGRVWPFMAALLFLFGVGWIMIHPVRIILDADRGEMEVLRISLVSRHHVAYPLEEVDRTEVKSWETEESRQSMLLVHLDRGDSAGWHDVTRASNMGNPWVAAKAINRWLETWRAEGSHENRSHSSP